MKTLRVIGQTRYEDRGYSNEESIAYLQLQKPEEINSFLTYNYGMDDDRFPLSFITEGQGSRGITMDLENYGSYEVYRLCNLL